MPQPSALNKGIRKGFLRKRGDYLRTYKGINVRKHYLVLYVRKNETDAHRFGVTVPKTVGTAVTRNRYKRWCKEIYRKMDLSGLELPVDFNVFVGNKRLSKKEDYKSVLFKTFEEQLQQALQSIVRNFK